MADSRNPVLTVSDTCPTAAVPQGLPQEPRGSGSGHATAQTPQPADGNAAFARPAIKRGRTATNLAANLANFAFGILVGFWFTPYLVHHLGTASYGLIPLVTQVTGYMYVVTILINSVVGRYVIIALEQNDEGEANQFFNTAFFANTFIVLILLLPAGLAAWNIDSLIIIPSGQETQVRWLFVFTIAGFFLTTIRAPLTVATFYTNRLDLETGITVLQQAAKVVLVVIMFSLLQPRLWQVGLAVLLSACCCWGCSIPLWRRLAPMLRLSFSCFRQSALRSLLSSGAWRAVDILGAILCLGIELVIVNRLFGAESAGRYAVALQWSALLRGVGTAIAAVFAPTITCLYARNELNALVDYTRGAVKLLGTAVALPVGLVCGFSVPLLRTWLGPEFTGVAPLMSLLTIHLSVNLAVWPLFNVQTATNRLKAPGLATVVAGVSNLVLSLYLAGPVGWGMYGVAAAGAVTHTAKSLFFTPLYAARILNLGRGTFLRELLPIILLTLLTAALCMTIATVCDLAGWTRLAIAGLAVSVAYAACAWWGVLRADERTSVKSIVLSLCGRARPVRAGLDPLD